jgi:hypothetical protein
MIVMLTDPSPPRGSLPDLSLLTCLVSSDLVHVSLGLDQSMRVSHSNLVRTALRPSSPSH